MNDTGPEMFGVQQGWQCPVCKRVYAPFMSMCTHCGEEKTQVTNVLDDTVWVRCGRKCKCGGDMLWNSRTVLTTYPPRWEFQCEKCGEKEYEVVGTGIPGLSVTLNHGSGGSATKLEEMAKLGILGWSQAGLDE